MRIEIVQLENVRSHVKSTVPFAKGFNCLVGGLGCGKSSILYSIDFAFFGEPVGRSFDYLLRDGVDNGKVTVQFVQNGKTYKISRGLRRRGKSINQDFDELNLFENEELISSVKNEAVAEQLKAITGLDKDLFREIVWVRQEHLKEMLNAQPRERQKRLDELFGLSDYETAWNNITIYQREYETEKRIHEKDADVVGMEKLGAEYNRSAEEFSLLEIELQDLAEKLTHAQKALGDADLKLEELEQTRERNEELKRNEAKILAELSNIEENLSSLAQRIKDRNGMTGNFMQRLKTLETQIDSFGAELGQLGISVNNQSSDTIRQYIASFDDQISNLKGEQEATLRSMQTDTKRITSLSAENRCPTCLQTITDDYKNDLMQRIQEENGIRQKSLVQLQHNIGVLQQVKGKATNAFSNFQMLIPRVEELRSRISEEHEAISKLSSEVGQKRSAEVSTREKLDSIRTELNRFDVSELEAVRKRREEAFRQYYSLDSERRTKENRKSDLTRRLNELKDRIDEAQSKIERMERIGKTIEIISGIRDAYRGIQPKLRSEFVKVLRSFVQQVLDGLVAGETSFLNVAIDETYTPYVRSEGGVERDVSNLSGGERTLLAFAYRLGLGQLIMQSRTGHGLSVLLLDEPTESLGTEDGSIDRLAEAISRFKAVEQTIAVTHSDAFAEKAEHVIRFEKEASESKVSVQK